MNIYTDVDLRDYHTFGVSQFCKILVEVNSVDELISVYQSVYWQYLPKVVLGKGSNILFTERFEGVVVINKLLGKSVLESKANYHLHIKSGEDWPSLVEWAVKNGYFGLENLALIPGSAGAAPIQNIGAYGMELKDICEYVDVLCLETFNIQRLTNQECLFGYRDSIFKHALYKKIVIIAIGLKLKKNWVANIKYNSLEKINRNTITSEKIFKRVCDLRKKKYQIL
ncbi:UDP-N-acetylenolpyruvoylglucosamine reductase [Candidatus Photodesmus katoptron]|nr:UDP-N-acetylenolpyruvoylglucosamine reductase [Candidatus Photodesmus katoptron]